MTKNPFPVELYFILQVENPAVISWDYGGLSFRIHNHHMFSTDTLPRHFRHSKFASFQRQLNFYQFQRNSEGPRAGSYFHPEFTLGNFFAVQMMKRNVRKSVDKFGSATASSSQPPSTAMMAPLPSFSSWSPPPPPESVIEGQHRMQPPSFSSSMTSGKISGGLKNFALKTALQEFGPAAAEGEAFGGGSTMVDFDIKELEAALSTKPAVVVAAAAAVSEAFSTYQASLSAIGGCASSASSESSPSSTLLQPPLPLDISVSSSGGAIAMSARGNSQPLRSPEECFKSPWPTEEANEEGETGPIKRGCFPPLAPLAAVAWASARKARAPPPTQAIDSSLAAAREATARVTQEDFDDGPGSDGSRDRSDADVAFFEKMSPAASVATVTATSASTKASAAGSTVGGGNGGGGGGGYALSQTKQVTVTEADLVGGLVDAWRGSRLPSQDAPALVGAAMQYALLREEAQEKTAAAKTPSAHPSASNGGGGSSGDCGAFLCVAEDLIAQHGSTQALALALSVLARAGAVNVSNLN